MKENIYYVLLGLNPDSDSQELQEAFINKQRELQALVHSPDRMVPKKAERGLRLLANAHQTLAIAEKKAYPDIKPQESNASASQQAQTPSEKTVPTKPTQSIVLLLDASFSMIGKKIDSAKRALLSFVKQLDFTVNEVSLLSFGFAIEWTGQLTQDRKTLGKMINRLDSRFAIRLPNFDEFKRFCAVPSTLIMQL